MRTMRRALRDGLTGSVGIALLAYLLVLQALVSSMSQSAMQAAHAGSAHVICSEHGILIAPSGADERTPDSEALRWHCATLCQLASMAAPAVLGAQAGYVQARWQPPAAAWTDRADRLPSIIRILVAEARPPPFSS